MKLLASLLLTTAIIAPSAFAAPSDPNPSEDAAPKMFELNGFFLPVMDYANDSVASFGNNNMTAPTEAGINGASPSGSVGRGRFGFQTGQSRFGVKVNANKRVHGKLEVDLVDFTKSTPTVASVPRIRIAKVEYDATPDLTVFMGQDWDVFSPLNAFGYNFVGGQFRAGNAGFMRQQLGVVGKAMDHSIEYAASLGFASPNGISSDQSVEVNQKPAYSARAAYVDGKLRAGVSGIYSQNGYYNTTTAGVVTGIAATDRDSWAGNVFAEWGMDNFDVKAEGYYGQNPGNLNLLTIGTANANGAADKELGGYISGKYHQDMWSVWATVGIASIKDGENVVTVNTQSNKGMRSNMAIKIGFDYALGGNLRAFYEGTWFHTKYVDGNRSAILNTIGLYLPI